MIKRTLAGSVRGATKPVTEVTKVTKPKQVRVGGVVECPSRLSRKTVCMEETREPDPMIDFDERERKHYEPKLYGGLGVDKSWLSK